MPLKAKIRHIKNDTKFDLDWAPDPISLKPKPNSAQTNTRPADPLDICDSDDRSFVKIRSNGKKAQPGIYDSKPEAIDFGRITFHGHVG